MKRTIVVSFIAFLLAYSPALAQTGLKDVLGKYFDVSVALNVDQTRDKSPATLQVIHQHFNSVVAENCMMSGELQPREGHFYWNDADAFVRFAEENGLSVHGHCLVCHTQMPQWMKIGRSGNAPKRKDMIERLRNHIYAVVGHYKGHVKSWDVISEAFEDDGSPRPTPWYNAIGMDYFILAFQFAHEADPDAELYYNDYSMFKPGKRKAVCRLIRLLKDNGYRIDGVGMQNDRGMDSPDGRELEASIKAFAAEGVKVSVTEQDLNKQSALENFSIYNKYRDSISRLCFRSLSDGDAWRNAKPLLKPIMKMFK